MDEIGNSSLGNLKQSRNSQEKHTIPLLLTLGKLCSLDEHDALWRG
jgi:hypothetical protein